MIILLWKEIIFIETKRTWNKVVLEYSIPDRQ